MAIGQHIKKYQDEKAAKAQQSVAVAEPESPVAVADPPVPAAPVAAADANLAGVMQQFAEILRELKSANSVESRDAAITQAEMLQQILVKTKPENVAPPLVSVFNPRGERDHPKPELKCTIFWVGYDLRTDTLTPDEVALLNQLEPCEKQVMKADGSRIPFTVTAKRASDLSIERLEVWFPCKGEARHNHGSMSSYLRQALGQSEQTVDEMVAELTMLRAQKKGA